MSKNINYYDIIPIQYPADDTTAKWRTTHFDYHKFESNLLKLDIKVVGLKKNDKHRTNDLIYSDFSVINIDRMSNVFHYLTRIQDEVHRFTITYHRTLRSKGSISSILDDIEGIGVSRKKALIKRFGSVSKMKNATISELSEIIPENIALELKKYLTQKDEKE